MLGWLLHAEFNKSKATSFGLKDICRECQCEQSRERREIRAAQLMFRKYGLTVDDYNKMYKEQNGKCAICKTDCLSERFGKFDVDHDHETGKIRGLLCNKCNTGLGLFKDNVEHLKSAIEYLGTHK